MSFGGAFRREDQRMERPDSTPPVANLLGHSIREAVGLLLPVSCVGCGEPDAALCDRCLASVPGPGPVRTLPDGFPVWAGTDYDGVVRRAILALKNDQRTDVARGLGGILRRAFDQALAELPARAGTVTDLRLATIPSSRSAYRRRGYRPVDRVLAKAGLKAEHPLTLTRQPGDQIGLGIAGRQHNLAGSMRAVRRMDGAAFLLIDDVITTGATVIEGRRALEAGGASVIGAAVIAATPRRIRPTL